MKRKKSIILSLFLVISMAIGATVYAANLGTLSYWYSDDSKIARWSSPPYT